MMTTYGIPLTQGMVALVDREDFERFGHLKWSVRVGPSGNAYAVRNKKRLHRLILDAPAEKCVDHINGNGLDNRRANLRLCTKTENNRNKVVKASKNTPFKGAYWHVRKKLWLAQICVNGKRQFLGYFKEPEQAAAAYDRAAAANFGEFARLNFDAPD